jgi:Cation efflux family
MLAGFANAVILMFVALNIVLEAGVHIMGAGHDVTTHRLLPISIAGLAVNLAGLLFVHEAHNHHHHVHGEWRRACCPARLHTCNWQGLHLHALCILLAVLVQAKPGVIAVRWLCRSALRQLRWWIRPQHASHLPAHHGRHAWQPCCHRFHSGSEFCVLGMATPCRRSMSLMRIQRAPWPGTDGKPLSSS